MLLHKLISQGIIHPPRWLCEATQYLTIMGSEAYAVSSGSSDVDIYGFAIPPKDIVFPHLAGHVPGFSRQVQSFDQWTEHHIVAPDNGKEYDFSVYGIVKFFALCRDNNPNMIDSLFTPDRCVIHSTAIGDHVRANRKLFLHKGAWHKFKGYAFSQRSKIAGKINASNPKRAEDIARFGFDVKFAYHVVRLIAEVEQIMVEHDLDLERNREQLKSIRRGEWTLEQIDAHFERKLADLETVYSTSTLPHSPDEDAIKRLLLECLEMYFGTLDAAIAREPQLDRLIEDMQVVLARYRRSGDEYPLVGRS